MLLLKRHLLFFPFDKTDTLLYIYNIKRNYSNYLKLLKQSKFQIKGGEGRAGNIGDISTSGSAVFAVSDRLINLNLAQRSVTKETYSSRSAASLPCCFLTFGIPASFSPQ